MLPEGTIKEFAGVRLPLAANLLGDVTYKPRLFKPDPNPCLDVCQRIKQHPAPRLLDIHEESISRIIRAPFTLPRPNVREAGGSKKQDMTKGVPSHRFPYYIDTTVLASTIPPLALST